MRIAVVLSGCGVRDGSEIHEAVITLLALDRRGAEVIACAPDVRQAVVDHRTGRDEPGATRSVLAESARIARGAIRELAAVGVSEIDAVVLPGGFGAARTLSDFATRGETCRVDPALLRLLVEAHAAGRPIAAFCIAPVILARVFGGEHPALTIGNDATTAAAVERMGAVHVPCSVQGVVVDRERRFVTTPAYMLGRSIGEVAQGIDRAVGALVDLVDEIRPAPDRGRPSAVRPGAA